ASIVSKSKLSAAFAAAVPSELHTLLIRRLATTGGHAVELDPVDEPRGLEVLAGDRHGEDRFVLNRCASRYHLDDLFHPELQLPDSPLPGLFQHDVFGRLLGEDALHGLHGLEPGLVLTLNSCIEQALNRGDVHRLQRGAVSADEPLDLRFGLLFRAGWRTGGG